MTDQLIAALDDVGPDQAQVIRLRLIAAGELALANADQKCLLYAGLAAATAARTTDDSVDPLLVAAVLSADSRQSGCTFSVVEELQAVAKEQDNVLSGALARELLLAACQVSIVLNEGLAELADFSSLEDWPA